MAVLAAFAIARDPELALRADQLTCYAIAAPRVGNHSFANAFNRPSLSTRPSPNLPTP